MLTLWPQPTDYNEAVQNWRGTLADPELRDGEPELLPPPLLTPKPRSGNFATVYRIDCASRRWAVRCFTREVRDRQRRYEAIDFYLRQSRLPYAVGFSYQPEGILVAGHRYPIVKMEWVSGKPLHAYIKANLRRADILDQLAGRWIQMCETMAAAGIAHGDLQHGNVLIVDGDIKLVDYDGMFVPALCGLDAPESGHPNYQHPSRAMQFDGRLDRFSAWLIYASIVALRSRPQWWGQFNGGDECLLFRKSDLLVPHNSEIFGAMERSGHRELHELQFLLRDLLTKNFLDAPALTREAATRLDVGSAPSAPVEHWWKDHAEVHTTTKAQPPAGPPTLAMDSAREENWFRDHRPQKAVIVPPVAFSNRASHEVIIVCASVLPALVVPFIAQFGAGLAIFALLGWIIVVSFALLIIWKRYRNEPFVSSKGASWARSVLKRQELAGARDNLNRAQLRRGGEQKLLLDAIRELQAKLLREGDPDAVAAAIRNKYAKLRAENHARRQRAEGEENERIWRIRFEANVTSIEQKIEQLDQGVAAQLSRALTDAQERHVRDYITSHQLDFESLPDLPDRIKDAVVASGIRTARDVWEDRIMRVSGVGQVRAAALMRWKRRIESDAARTVPTALPTSLRNQLEASAETERRNLIEQKKRVEREIEERIQVARADIKQRISECHRHNTFLGYQELDETKQGRSAAVARGAPLIAEIDRRNSELSEARIEARAEIASLRSTVDCLEAEATTADRIARAAAALTFRLYLARIFRFRF